jgi:muramoyltetrapeptide carboxypeptidase
MNYVTPKYLEKGDLILIVSPAKAIEKERIDFAIQFLLNIGYQVEVGQHASGSHHYFSGTDQERAADFQWAINHPTAKAILCARGGYGCVRILDRIEWANQILHPKWIIGFSDVTVFHQFMQRSNIQSLHATMPLNFKQNSHESLESMFDALQGKSLEYQLKSSPFNKIGEAEGVLIGGNLSILHSLLGTNLQASYENSILFIEDVGEALYALDRMFYSLEKVGILNTINGLIIGGMTDMKDSEIPFGLSYSEIILSHFEYRKIPIIFDFPAGHLDDNRALILGRKVHVLVQENMCTVAQFSD